MPRKHIFDVPFSQIYPLYIAKVNRKNKSKDEVDLIIYWLTGYNKDSLKEQLDNENSLRDFFNEAPKMNPLRDQIKGLICGIRVEEITDELMQNIRYLDKLIDELAKGRNMDKILRK